MKIDLINTSENCRRIILIFPGWSCDKTLYSGLRFPGWDTGVANCHDSDSEQIDFKRFAKRYPTVYVFAWSLGVADAQLNMPANLVTAAFAVNGTLHPADDLMGIPTSIFKATADSLSAKSLLKFRRRMAGTQETYRRLFLRDFSQLEIEKLRQQLYAVYTDDKIAATKPGLPWRKAFVSDKDTIFPPENMERAWKKSGIPTRRIDAHHYVDISWIMSMVIPEQHKISERFNNARGTYDSQALPQRMMAEKLEHQLMQLNPAAGGSVLEIGQGTGLFTSRYFPKLKPDHADFVDLTAVRPENISGNCRFFTADAEDWLENSESYYDYILSSATVQWFVNLPAFIKNCHSHLKENGILAFSTFLPGNLEELDTFRPSPIHYHSENQIVDFMQPFFRNICLNVETISVGFPSPRQLLMHLKETGVGGSAPSAGISPAALRNVRKLSYRCAYVTAVRKEK